MFVTKRDGNVEKVSFDKVLNRIERLSENLTVNFTEVAQKVCARIYDHVNTSELDDLAAQICASMITDHPDYDTLASRISVSNHHKNTSPSFSEVIEMLYRGDSKIVSDDLYEVVQNHKDKFNSYIDYNRDYVFDFFGFKTLERAYLLRINGRVVERPQHLFMRVSIGIHGNDIREVLETYDAMSTKKFTHATPTLFNFGTRREQGSSCFLMHLNEDSINGIYDTLKECALISKYAGGIGVHIHNVRGKNAHIRGTNGYADGIIPMLRVFNSTAKYVNQCFAPETMIYTKKGCKQICDIVQYNDEVITLDGTYKKVLGVVENTVSKSVLEIRATHSFEPITVTKEHEIYVIRNQSKTVHYDCIKRRIDKKMATPQFVSASELTTDDLIGYPKFKYPEDTEAANDNNPLIGEFYRLYGIVLCDGKISKKDDSCTISLNVDFKIRTFEFLEEYLRKLEVDYETTRNKQICHITFPYTSKIPLTRNDIYDENDEKFIKTDLMNLNRYYTEYLVKGMIDTECSAVNRELYFYTPSRALAYGLKYLCYKLDILTSGYIKSDNGKRKTVNYCVRVPKVDALREIVENIGTIKYAKYFEHDGMLWGRLKNISEIEYEGKVYDLNIEDNHNYTVSSLGLVHNSGRRNGSIAIYLEPWHVDIESFLDIRKNHGNEEERARDLFQALWIPDLFMKRVKEDGEWSLMCPDTSRGLSDVYGEEFETLYLKYESEGRFVKKISAQSLWRKILISQIETGTPYMLYKDSVNKKTNQQNLGTIKSSNLCAEIAEFTSPDEIAVCNLASICLPSYVNLTEGRYEFHELHKYVKIVTKNLNKVIDKNYYPVDKTKVSNLRHRPIGIGVQGLADTFALLRYEFESPEADELNRQIFETIYHAALECSNEIAHKRHDMIQQLSTDELTDSERVVLESSLNLTDDEKTNLVHFKGAYSSFEGSPISKGIYQFDMWGTSVNNTLHDWSGLRENICKYGIRNSLLVAPMPTASTSQIMGFNECFEPFTSNLYKRKTLAGEFICINRYLLRDLVSLGIWSRDLKDKIIINEGCLANISEIPEDVRNLYKTVWEIKQRNIIDKAAARASYVCQSQSMNLFVEEPNQKKLTSMHFYAWEKGLKTGMYYLRTKPRATTQQFSIDPTKAKSNIVSSQNEEQECVACSA